MEKSCRLSVGVYRGMSGCKDYGFRDQITRSALSIASNIAEGVERLSDKESIQFLSISKGSAAELITQIYIGMEAGFIDKAIGRDWLVQLESIQAMPVGLIKHYKRTINDR